MDSRANSNLFFLHDEKFDFDVSLSPASSKGDEEEEDEVFVGPLSHKERCVSVNVLSRLEDSAGSHWSPLTGDQLEAVCEEASRLAEQLQGLDPNEQTNADTIEVRDEDEKTTKTKACSTAELLCEEFVQDAGAKLDVLDGSSRVLSPVKRETFCVQDSPRKQLPPAIQRRLLRGSSSNTAVTSSTRPSVAVTSRRSCSTSSPAPPAVRGQPRTGLRGKAALGVAVVLPSKPNALTSSCSTSKNSKVDKSRLQPPGKSVSSAGSRRRSPGARPSSRAGSCEDLLSDSASVTSDVSDSSLNSERGGRRSLAPPTKLMRNLSGVRAPPAVQARKVTDKRTTSSSSSSVSSFNSSISMSPAKGKPNSSLNRSVSTGPAPCTSRPRRSTVYTPSQAPAAATRRSMSVAQTRRPSEAEPVKSIKATPLKKAESTPVKLTPNRRALERTSSVPASLSRTQGGLKNRLKPEASVVPSTGIQTNPKRLVSVSSVDSVAGTPSAQLKPRRPSALPTPVRRRMSALPVATPTSSMMTRTNRPPPTNTSDPCSGSTKRDRSCSPAPAYTQEAEPVDIPEIQPFCLEEEEECPVVPPPSQIDQSERVEPRTEQSQSQLEPIKNLIELETKEESNSKTQEVLLLDLPAPSLPEKLLIDLTNTPVRMRAKPCSAAQLIDLSSPLIRWSPEDKTENTAPLINLSF